MSNTERDVRQLARDLASLTQRVDRYDRGQKTNQLSHASIHGRTLDFYDSEDHLVAQVGVHPDGSASIVHREGPTPPVPRAPVVEASIGGLTVNWDGGFLQVEGEDVPIPTDLAYAEVHVEHQGVTGFRGVIPRSGGSLSVVPLEVEPHSVHLVAVSSAHKRSEPSPEVTETPLPAVGPGSITETEIADDSISTPKLQANSVTAQKLSAILTISTRIVSGDPDGARVEMNETGLFAYDGDDITFSLSADGSAFFSGDIRGANIYGSSLESTGFNNETEEGIVGWRLSEDGDAEFRSISVGNNNFNINPDGQASFQSLDTNSLSIGGEDFGSMLAGMGGRCISRTRITGGTSNETDGSATAGSQIFCRVVIPNVMNHMYLVHLDNIAVSPGNQVNHVGILARSQMNAPPNRNSGTYLGRLMRVQVNGPGLWWLGGSRLVSVNDAQEGDDLHIGLFVESSGSGASARVDGPHFVSIFDMGPTRTVEELTYNLEADTAPTVQRTKTYNATWSGSWFNSSNWPSAKLGDNDHLYQGRYDSNGGTRYGKIGFNWSAIQSDLAGATINRVELRLSNQHSYSAGGHTVRVGSHNNTSEPTGATSLTGDFSRWTHSWNRGQTKWVTLPNSFGNQLRDNSMKGITIGRTDAGTQAEYGYLRGASASTSLRPQLRITYTR
ncbi:hypothetical protein ACFYOC_24150 [Nocardiopsis alba]|uniref:hypothetical protein n=1 Tax=Nocardiopsis alba TaxID=53437 RepID=UPI0036A9FED7